MKSIFFPAAIALSTTLSGAALAADSPAAASPPPVVADPITPILTPIGNALDVIVQPVVVAPANAVTAVIAPSPPPAPAAPAPVHHRRHHRHHRST